jgi:transcriptional regulator with XRE-family HTH domain
MQLREVIREIRRKKNWTQAEMAQKLRVSQQNIQGMENAGSNLEKQFAIFLKLLPVCRESGIDPAQDLNPPSDEEVLDEIKSDDKTPRGNARRRKKGHEAAPDSALSKSRILRR